MELDETLQAYLIQILNEKFYTTTNLEELTKINRLYKALGHETEPWLSALQPR